MTKRNQAEDHLYVSYKGFEVGAHGKVGVCAFLIALVIMGLIVLRWKGLL